MAETPPSPPHERHELIITNITPVAQTFYLVTEETLEAYATAGFLSNLFLTIFGVCAGGLVTCWVAQATSAFSKETQMAASTAKYLLLAFSGLFLILSLFFLGRVKKQRSSIFKLPPTRISTHS